MALLFIHYNDLTRVFGTELVYPERGTGRADALLDAYHGANYINKNSVRNLIENILHVYRADEIELFPTSSNGTLFLSVRVVSNFHAHLDKEILEMPRWIGPVKKVGDEAVPGDELQTITLLMPKVSDPSGDHWWGKIGWSICLRCDGDTPERKVHRSKLIAELDCRNSLIEKRSSLPPAKRIDPVSWAMFAVEVLAANRRIFDLLLSSAVL